jgi:tRNA dimethylallyltransferase
MRALEICLSARRPATEIFSAGRDALEGFRVLKLGLFPPREQLYQRLEARVEKMFEAGLVEETALTAKRTGFEVKPFESIGYKQALQVVKGEISVRDAVFYARRDTRRYAKRQMTWFRQEPGLEVVGGFGEDPAVIARVEARVGGFLA